MAVLLTLGTASLRGQAVLSFASTNGGFLDNNSRLIGWQFSVTQNLAVSALGWFDWNGDGLVLSHQVGIWDVSDQSLVAAVTVPAGTAATLSSQFRYVTLGSLTLLEAGKTYRIAGLDDNTSAPGDEHVWDATISSFADQVNGFSADSRITLTSGSAIGPYASSFAYPTELIADNRSVLMGPNFIIAVPEPATNAAGFGAVVLGLAIARRKRCGR